MSVQWESKVSESLRRLCSAGGAQGNYRIIIEFVGTDPGEVRSLVSRHNGHVILEIQLLSGIVAEVPYAAIEGLAKSNRVKRISADSPVKASHPAG